MPAPLSDRTVALIKATVPALEQHGLAITRRMYELMFRNPAIAELFNQSHQDGAAAQPRALAGAVLAYARHIDDLAPLSGAVERIAQKHVALNILPEHYPHVATALLAAIGDVLGDAASAEILAAWGEAYWFLAEVLVGREASIYRDLAAAPGGWNGWRDFVIEAVVEESSVIRSFTLVPDDGGPVLRHRPGQYLGFAFDVPGIGAQRRNYSISCAPNDRAYRITVKREAMGRISNWLHGHARPGTMLRVAAPAGDFFLDPASTAPVALVSGGVGLTPMVSMLETIVATTPHRPVFWVHGALNGSVHAMREHVRALEAQAPGVSTATFYAEAAAADRLGVDYDHEGLVTAAFLHAHVPAETVFHVCGPKPFMRAVIGGLAALGVPGERLRFEFFGPADEDPAALFQTEAA
ncbi:MULTISPECIES: NO-inducible flavohemoprotein [unclassified Acidiphilium]|uniref:NO-inducible flavohemoprotein n=1 Tax=unclassified Acidiphilium TaxID=2617493 RepID=UPI000BDC85F3|nr:MULTISPECIES: NO-inducible flavohemoprotein [unclassified Acidiphilium]OYV55973.1 MAG: nitric oxide dioxygenase [Acidiphilium sp. 20-67-58]HQT61549.1 NO-inducible flavohemoprotein [Acidiphilium sp.]